MIVLLHCEPDLRNGGIESSAWSTSIALAGDIHQGSKLCISIVALDGLER